ncbi:MAG: tRNA pseudouridine(13) synthase TruD [Thermoplasmata archaeon]|nr:tRNA pseudouridine(13) synthase TruD [Thermoplasmata archaeon]
MLLGPEVPPVDAELGLRCYGSTTPGTGGRLKASAEDFEVREISAYPMPDENGLFTILRIESRMREQHALVGSLARALGLPPGAIAWAGTKDRRAITEQLLSVRAAPIDPLRLDLPGVRVLDLYRARTGLVLGHHYGNAFRIRVSEVPLGPEEARERIGATLAELRTKGGLPNYFGPQRFGEVRPVTHLVGRALLHGDVPGAVELYLSAELGLESGPGALARKAYRDHHDARRALEEFPRAFLFERRMLDHLAQGHPPERAFRALPRELRVLFIHAYQAWLFNEYLSGRLERGISPEEPAPGDTVLRVARDGTFPGTGAVPVSLDNLAEATALVRRGLGRLAGPLVGYGSGPLTGTPLEILGPLLEREGISERSFLLPSTPDIASEGNARPLLLAVPPLGQAVEARDGGTGPSAYRLTFSLPKGAYATVLLRELLKSGSPGAS